ncbi:MAG: MBL fold metallo-hydrolase [Ruminococcaceae bacterium]|nr:MBL fold metallo-hydrolase [Oscillospiraceae bacterium]
MRIVPVSPYSFGANTYLLISDGHALVIDPVVSVDATKKSLSNENAVLDGILLTHGHFDHTVSVDTLREAFSVPLYIHENDAEMLGDAHKSAYYTFFGRDCVHFPAEQLLHNGSVITLGDETVTVIHTPGHSKGSVCYHCGSFLVTGDTLFADTIGRCDLWGGNEGEMRNSLEKLRTLDKSLKIHPGHGAPALLGEALDNAAYYI